MNIEELRERVASQDRLIAEIRDVLSTPGLLQNRREELERVLLDLEHHQRSAVQALILVDY